MQQFAPENWPRDRWPNFSPREFTCSTSGEIWVDVAFMDKLQRLRNGVGFPLKVTSGYRSPQHPIEKAKIDAGKRPGAHNTGQAVDIAVRGDKAWAVVHEAMLLDFTGLGIQQAGEYAARFIHLDTLPNGGGFPRPTIWSY